MPPETFKGALIALMVGGGTGRLSKNQRQAVDDDEQAQAIYREFDEGVLDWVKEEKTLKTAPGEIDHGKSPRQIANRILVFFDRRPPIFKDGRDSAAARADAREKLSRNILPYLKKRARSGKADQDIAEQWLRAVGLAWMDYMGRNVPPAIDRSVHRLWQSPLRP